MIKIATGRMVSISPTNFSGISKSNRIQVSAIPGQAQQEDIDGQNDEKIAVEERLPSPQIEEFRYHFSLIEHAAITPENR